MNVFLFLCWCCFTLAWCMSSCEPNLFATSPIPHSLPCVLLVLAFTFALFSTQMWCFWKKYIIVVSAIVTFFLFHLLWRHILKVNPHDVRCPAGTHVVCISVTLKRKIISNQNKGQFSPNFTTVAIIIVYHKHQCKMGVYQLYSLKLGMHVCFYWHDDAFYSMT